MKVYELMEQLSEYPAGAEVEVGGYLSMKEIKNAETFDGEVKEYRCVGPACDIDENGDTVTIYFWIYELLWTFKNIQTIFSRRIIKNAEWRRKVRLN